MSQTNSLALATCHKLLEQFTILLGNRVWRGDWCGRRRGWTRVESCWKEGLAQVNRRWTWVETDWAQVKRGWIRVEIGWTQVMIDWARHERGRAKGWRRWTKVERGWTQVVRGRNRSEGAGYEKFFSCTVTGLCNPSFVHWKCVICELQFILRFSGFYAQCSRVQLLYCTKELYIVRWELAVRASHFSTIVNC